MKSKTWPILILTLCILGISVCLPSVLFGREETRLLRTVRTEKLKEPSEIQLPIVKTEDKLGLISTSRLAASNTVMVHTSGYTEQSMNQAAALAQKELDKLHQKGLIPETNLSDYSIKELSHTAYSDTASGISVGCYFLWAEGAAHTLSLTLDSNTGKIYSLALPPVLMESASSISTLSPDDRQIWADYLGISLAAPDGLYEYDDGLYQVEHSDASYTLSEIDDTSGIFLQLNTGFLSISSADDTTMTEKSRTYDAIGY